MINDNSLYDFPGLISGTVDNIRTKTKNKDVCVKQSRYRPEVAQRVPGS